ncbi:MAG: hypothetical protein J5808_07485 [Paludibacteraceae bacterium]|nr:hypothetical protein [Paludibacteraceae bacterium]
MKVRTLFGIAVIALSMLIACNNEEPQNDDKDTETETPDPTDVPEPKPDDISTAAIVGNWQVCRLTVNLGDLGSFSYNDAATFDTQLGALVAMYGLPISGECVFATTATCNSNYTYAIETSCSDNPLFSSSEGTWSIDSNTNEVVFTYTDADETKELRATMPADDQLSINATFEINSDNSGTLSVLFQKQVTE